MVLLWGRAHRPGALKRAAVLARQPRGLQETGGGSSQGFESARARGIGRRGGVRGGCCPGAGQKVKGRGDGTLNPLPPAHVALCRDLPSFTSARGDEGKGWLNHKQGGRQRILLKRLAILALATVWLLGTDLAAAPGVGPKSGDDPSTTTQSLPPNPQSARRPLLAARAAHDARVAPGGSAPSAIPPRATTPRAMIPPSGRRPSRPWGTGTAASWWSIPTADAFASMVNQKLALASGFTPCSTFKPVVALAALKEGIITPTTKLYVGGRIRRPLPTPWRAQTNVFFRKLGEMLGFRRLTEYAHEFGLGQKAGLNIPGESAGRYPSAPHPRKAASATWLTAARTSK